MLALAALMVNLLLMRIAIALLLMFKWYYFMFHIDTIKNKISLEEELK
jgi:hypothetical protein